MVNDAHGRLPFRIKWRKLEEETVSIAPQKIRHKRETWNSQTAFLIAAIGSAIGLGNIWRFPGVAYTNGGGAFLVPYVVALLVIGLPVLFLDYAIGHKFRGSPPLALRRITPKGELLGWFQVGVSFVIFTYYAVVLAWAAQYTIFSITDAWGDDSLNFFLTNFLQVTEAPEGFSWTPVMAVTIPLVLVWVLAIFITARGLSHGIEAANKVFLPLLIVLFIALVIRAMFLPGAADGLNALFTPQWSALMDFDVWVAAMAQIFYSLSVAFGIMITYASYLPKKANLTGAGMVAGFANSSFEILAGIGVFGALGFMAFNQGVGVGELEGLTGPILSFVTFPQIISLMPGGPIFGVLFFSSLVLAGFTSLLSLLQVVSGGLQDKFGYSPKNAALIMGIPAMIISVAVFGTQSGLNALDVVDSFINNIGVVGSAVALTLLAALGGRRLPYLRRHLNSVSSIKMPRAWNLLVGILAPAALGFMLISAIVSYLQNGYEGFSTSYLLILGWGCVGFAIAFAIIMTALPWKTDPEEAFTGPEDTEIPIQKGALQ